MRATAIAFACLAVMAAPAFAQPTAAPSGPQRFAPEIAAFAAADREHMPAPCGFLFVGSSSIRFWKTLAADMAPAPALNRGFGGSTVADVDYYFDQWAAPYRPPAIVFYSGWDDLSPGAPPGAVTGHFSPARDLET